MSESIETSQYIKTPAMVDAELSGAIQDGEYDLVGRAVGLYASWAVWLDVTTYVVVPEAADEIPVVGDELVRYDVAPGAKAYPAFEAAMAEATRRAIVQMKEAMGE